METLELSPSQVKSLLVSSAVALIDCRHLRRTPQEFARGRIAGSINVPLCLYENGIETTGQLVTNTQFAEQVKALIRGPVAITCFKGTRGTMAAANLVEKGVPNIAGNLAGGLAAWQAEGFNVEGQVSAPFLK